MSTKTLEEALQISRQLAPGDQLRLVRQLAEELLGQIEAAEPSIDLLSQSGLGAGLWRAVGVEDYIEQERASWSDGDAL
jgi:hypothetical protein